MVSGARGFQEGGRDVCRQEVVVVRMAKQLSLNSNEVLEVNEEWEAEGWVCLLVGDYLPHSGTPDARHGGK
ncbi:hypothetical protein E2C01_017156 [Portunus trituberculatus]|uniref:Uncharacterized protein n=1 Tax=Portunus trituberculatus TaxID=210409 RepID=A0A5B7DT15_PORTR|nr:hypothetical protein [Portunus trituberculatus]